MKQVQIASGSGDYEISTTETVIHTDFVDHHFTSDCAKIKASVAHDPLYKSAMVEERGRGERAAVDV